MTREEKAREYFKSGYNCSQAVLLAFGDKTGLDEKTAARAASSFGGGMGKLREVCGAVSGMFMALGLIEGYDNPKAREEKIAQYKSVQELAGEFSAQNGSIICRELLGLGEKKESPIPSLRTKEYYKKRPCEELVADAVRIFEAYLAKKA
jgi:C_GCAxxG_C_C family probable redox protein